MYILETIARLVLLFAKAITLVIIEAINIIRSEKTIVIVFWILLSLAMNLIWIVRVNVKKHLVLPIINLTMVNFILIATVLENEWIFSVKVIFPGADAVCKLIKWVETASVIICCGLIIYILSLFKHPRCFPSKIKKSVLKIVAISTILTLSQAFLFETKIVDTNNQLCCSVGVPDEENNFIAYAKPVIFVIPFALLLLSYIFLYNIFKGTKEEFLRRAEIKFIEIETYCLVHIHFWCYYLVLSVVSYFSPMLKHLVEYFHFALILSGCIFACFCPFILTRILDKTTSEEIPRNRRFRRIPLSLSSSYDTDSIKLSDDHEYIVSDAECNFNPNAVFP